MKVYIDKIKNLFNNTFFMNITFLIGGTLIGQLLTIMISPILTRQYSPEEMGIYSIFISIVSIFVVFSSFRYETVIPLPDDENEAIDIVYFSLFLTIIITLISLIMVLFFRDFVGDILNADGLNDWLLLLPLSVFVNGFFRILNYWSIRKKSFKRISSHKMINSISTSFSQVGFGLPNNNFSGGLIIGSFIGLFLSTARLTFQIAKSDNLFIKSKLYFSKLSKVFYRYKNFTIFSTLSDALNIISTLLPSIFLAYYFNTDVVGLYSLGYRTLSLPALIIGGAVGQVLLPKLVEANQSNKLAFTTFDMFKKLYVGGYTPIVLITLVSPILFGIIFGLDWIKAGTYVQLFSGWLFLIFITSPLSVVYIVKENQKPNLVTNILMIVFRVIGFVIAGNSNDVILSLALFGIIGVVLSSVNLFYILSMAGIKIYEVVKFIFRQSLLDSIYFLPTSLLLLFCSNNYIIVGTAILSGIVFLLIKGYYLVFNKKVSINMIEN